MIKQMRLFIIWFIE